MFSWYWSFHLRSVTHYAVHNYFCMQCMQRNSTGIFFFLLQQLLKHALPTNQETFLHNQLSCITKKPVKPGYCKAAGKIKYRNKYATQRAVDKQVCTLRKLRTLWHKKSPLCTPPCPLYCEVDAIQYAHFTLLSSSFFTHSKLRFVKAAD